MMGYVRDVKVQIGDHVREGQLLVTLDPRDLDVSSRRAESAREEVRAGIPEADSAVAAAKANLDLAQVTFGRMQEMYQKKSISNQEFDEASARLKAAQAALDMARARRTQLDSRLAQADQEVRSTEVTRSYAEVWPLLPAWSLPGRSNPAILASPAHRCSPSNAKALIGSKRQWKNLVCRRSGSASRCLSQSTVLTTQWRRVSPKSSL